MEKTIRNEKLQAANTDSVTSGCWRGTLPYFQMASADRLSASAMAKPSR